MEEGEGNRIPLRDATNIYGKRALPLVPGKFVIGRGVGAAFGNHQDTGQPPPDPAKRVRKGSGELFGGGEEGNAENRNWKTWSLMEPEKDIPKKSLQPSGAKENVVDSSTQVDANRQIQKKGKFPSALNPGLHLIKGGGVASHVNEPVQRDTVASASSVEQEDREESLLDVPGVSGYYVDGKGLCHSSLDSIDQVADTTASSQKLTLLDLFDKSRVKSVAEPSMSSDHKALNPDGIGKEKGACVTDDVTLNAGTHPDRPCSCPLCLKASWLLADFLCQDYKGRLTEVKKSRKAAGIFVGRSFFRDSAGSSLEKFTKLERDVMQRWRSLFLHTENILLREGTELQASIIKLNELRAKCERDFEAATGMPSSNLFFPSHNLD